MTLTRYQIRNEYGLADRELYQSTDKEDAEALLEGSSMAGFVGLLRQLGDLAEFAGEVFHNLHEELTTTAARGQGLATRLQQLEEEVPKSVEIPVLSQTDHSTFFYESGLEWHSNLQTKENLISPSKLPHCIMDSYEECRGPPQLYLLDKFDVDGSGSCLKRYSDPYLLKTLTASSVLATSKLSQDERPSKTKRVHTSNGERLGDSQTSHAKLHQLFLVEHVENGHNDPEFHVKLKRRHLNGPQINSSSGTGYMEKFLKNSLPEGVHETLDPPMETEVTACNVQEDLSTPSLVYPSNGYTIQEREMESIADEERPYVEGGAMDTDAPVSTETEAKETDGNDDKAAGDFRQIQIFDSSDVTQTEVLAQFHSSEEGESSLFKLTQVPVDAASEGGTKTLTTTDIEDDNSQHVFSVETESEMSLTGLVEDHFSSISSQESEKESDCLLIENQHISTFDNCEDISLGVDALHDSAVPKEGEDGALIFDTPRDVHTENMNPSASSWQEDALANSDLAEISSDSGQEDPQTISIIADGSSELEVQILDTQRDGTVFSGDNQTSLNDKASETVPEVVDLETISDPQECFSPEHYIQTHSQGKDSSSETESEDPTKAAAESLPLQDVPLGVQCSPSDETEALNAPDQGTITSLNGDISESILSMDVPMSPLPQDDLEITPPFPPLPPTQWWMGKQQLVESVKTTEAELSPEPSFAYNGNQSFYIGNGLVQANEAQDPLEDSVTARENQLQNEPSKETEGEQSPSESVAWVSQLTPEATSEAESTQGLEALEWFSQNFKEHTNTNLAKLEEEPQLDYQLEPPGEIEQDKNSYEQNEKVEKLSRDNGSFVIGIDQSMLRKVSERNRTQLGARVEENDSILEIIRSKSFNLRPADASVRHNFQVSAVPTTNLKVAAILEKASSLRHAMAGSDDDHDSDSWSE